MIGPHKHGLYIAVVSIILSLSMAAQGVPGRAATANKFTDALTVAKAISAAGRRSDAARARERVVQMNPVNEEYWEHLAEAHYKSGEFSQSISAFEKVLDLGGYYFPSGTSPVVRSF